MSALGTSSSSLLPPWVTAENIRPYVITSSSVSAMRPGLRHEIDWFQMHQPLIVDPLRKEGTSFAEAARKLDERLFLKSGMAMAKWVYYDCAILPGVISGFAMKRTDLTSGMLAEFTPDPSLEWVPISLFIIIPMMQPRQWMAHNLCSMNNVLPESERLRGLGFLTKAFGLWFTGVELLCGVTGWMRPAIRLHANFGFLEILTATSPLHNFPESMTYRMAVDSAHWPNFFATHKDHSDFDQYFEWTNLTAYPKDRASLEDVQERIEQGEGPFFLNGTEILTKPLGEPLRLFRPKAFEG